MCLISANGYFAYVWEGGLLQSESLRKVFGINDIFTVQQ